MFPFFSDEEPPFKIDVFEDYIYYSTFKTHDIYIIDKFNSSQKPTLLVKGFQSRIGDILLVHSLQQKDFSNGEVLLCVNISI